MRRLQLGSCPDSWGVWFADDPRQTPWDRFLDELSAAGYHWPELGPYGYPPTDPARLRDELAQRELTCAGGTVAGVGGRHKDFDAVDFDLPLPIATRTSQYLNSAGLR
jgi:inosose dehydratase